MFDAYLPPPALTNNGRLVVCIRDHLLFPHVAASLFFLQAPEPKIRTGGPDNVDADDCSYNWIHHNTLRTHGNECVDVKEGSTNNLIEYNVCESQKDPNSGGFDLRGDKNTVRYNEISECIGSGVRVGGDAPHGGGNHIYGNTIRNMGSGAFNVMTPDQGIVCENTISGATSVRHCCL